ncbi:hypothetical protein VP01_5286g1 [Puccinia sorghi]|uniref:Uncharacterized protein n=1 Tax=Puccinia sorghi TaxID=27349 RepID=A0A0L6UKC2_9BASI|nr:hypothetical protein VP01_5286g1 [Puccinia sorghi]
MSIGDRHAIRTLNNLMDQKVSLRRMKEVLLNLPKKVEKAVLVKMEKEKQESTYGYISVQKRKAHPESNIARLLYRLNTPSLSSIKIIKGADPKIQGTVGDSTNNTDPNSNNQVVERSHYVDILHEFSNVIVDVIMGYVILKTHALSAPPMTTTDRKKNYRRNTRSSARYAETTGAVFYQQTSTAINQVKNMVCLSYEGTIKMPLSPIACLFLKPWVSSLSTPKPPKAIKSQSGRTCYHIWQLLQPSLLSSNQVVPLLTPPTRSKLAEVITTDFLNHWRQMQPSSPFLIPNSSQRQIIKK